MRTFLFAAVLASLVPATAAAQDGLPRATTIARQNQATNDAMEFLRFQAKKIKDPAIATATKDILENPAPTFMTLWPDAAARAQARQQLVDAGLLSADVTVDALFPPLKNALTAPAPFWVAPAGDPRHHHGYPGGLAVHTAFNLQAALDLARNYRQRYDVRLDPDLVIAGPTLHDAMKPWAFQWQEDGSITAQPSIADTGSHHIFGIAEALHRGMPNRLVVTIASAHDAPTGATAARVVGYLRAAAILARVDPVAKGLLVHEEGSGWALASLPPIEATVNHLADHDYVLTDPAAAAETAALDELAVAAMKKEGIAGYPARLNWMRHRIHAKVSGVRIYGWLVEGGPDRVAEELKKRSIPFIDKHDVPPTR